MNVLVTGGAGFIGSHLIDALIMRGNFVICADKFVFDSYSNIEHLSNDHNFKLVNSDMAVQENVLSVFNEHSIDMVYHLAANSDIQSGSKAPDMDFNNTFMTTKCILEAMRMFAVKRLFFSSTSAVYGEMCDVALSEDTGGIKPVSYYGGAKLASEALISAYTAMNDFCTVIFRFPNVIGPRLTHGVIYDFVRKLRNDSKKLEILGDGKQCKPYIYVSDLIDAIMLITAEWNLGADIYNIGVKGEGTTVTQIAEAVATILGYKNVEFVYTGGNRGWKGDVPRFEYDITKITAAGWEAKYSSLEAVKKTIGVAK